MKKQIDTDQNILWQVAEINISYKNKVPIKEQPKISGSATAEMIFRINWSNEMDIVEEFNVLFLSRANYVKAFYRVSKGGLTGTVADLRIIYGTALRMFATGIIVAHNHPSGNLQPSVQDIELTKKLKQIGTLHDIPLLDHLILLPQHGFYSFADEGNI